MQNNVLFFPFSFIFDENTFLSDSYLHTIMNIADIGFQFFVGPIFLTIHHKPETTYSLVYVMFLFLLPIANSHGSHFDMHTIKQSLMQ